MGYETTVDEERRFLAFVRDLERISAKHGVLLQVTGGVSIQEAPLQAVRYSEDSSSGDLRPIDYKPYGMKAASPWDCDAGNEPVRQQEAQRIIEARKARIAKWRRDLRAARPAKPS